MMHEDVFLQLRCEAHTWRACSNETSPVRYTEEFYGFKVVKCYLLMKITTLHKTTASVMLAQELNTALFLHALIKPNF